MPRPASCPPRASRRDSRRAVLAGLGALPLAACGAAGALGAEELAQAAPADTGAAMASNAGQRYRLERVPGVLQNPWGLAFLPDGAMLITERSGRLRRARLPGGIEAAPVAGPPEVAATGQGGLLDIALHPGFAANGLVYLSHSVRTAAGNATAVTRARYDGRALAGAETILHAAERQGGGGLHFGSRLAFGRDGTLFVSLGDRNQRDRAQDAADTAGKVLRVTDTGAVPPDNPFLGRPGVNPALYTTGHRNPQGMARHPDTGAIWLHEHGARGGDEVNILRAGANYGWPVTTHGVDYSGARIGVGPRAPGVTDPVHVWVPSIAPSGMAFCSGRALPAWRGNLFVGALAGQCLVRLTLDGERVQAEERLLSGTIGRIRDVREGPDGALYLLTDAREGALWRIVPA